MIRCIRNSQITGTKLSSFIPTYRRARINRGNKDLIHQPQSELSLEKKNKVLSGDKEKIIGSFGKSPTLFLGQPGPKEQEAGIISPPSFVPTNTPSK